MNILTKLILILSITIPSVAHASLANFIGTLEVKLIKQKPYTYKAKIIKVKPNQEIYESDNILINSVFKEGETLPLEMVRPKHLEDNYDNKILKFNIDDVCGRHGNFLSIKNTYDSDLRYISFTITYEHIDNVINFKYGNQKSIILIATGEPNKPRNSKRYKGEKNSTENFLDGQVEKGLLCKDENGYFWKPSCASTHKN